MSKYRCICGVKFKERHMAEFHIQMNQGHLILEQSKRTRFLVWFWSLPFNRIFRFTGAIIIYFVLINHFNISWTLGEATLIGLGMGMYIE
jgi:hypothetical protein